MKEKETDHHDNTGKIIAIVVIVLLLLGLVAYFAMNGKDDVDDAIDDAVDTTENIIDNDNDEKTAADVAGSYQAKVTTTAGIDEDNNADDDYIELVLDEDGTAKLVITSESNDIITGTFSVNNNRIRLTNANTANDETTDNNTTDNDTTDNDTSDTTTNQTYEFRINDDDTLTYINLGINTTLAKVNNDNLKYIK